MCPLHEIQKFFPVLPKCIIEYWPTWDRKIASICEEISLFKTSAKSQNCTGRVPLLFLASESRFGAKNSTYQMSNVTSLHGGGLQIDVTPSSSKRPASYTAGHVDHEKRNTFLISMRALSCFSNFYRYGASLTGPKGRLSSAIRCLSQHTSKKTWKLQESQWNCSRMYFPIYVNKTERP